MSFPERTDVFIVGGGPAGLATAIAARRQGLTVTVADVRRPPIDKACGEGLLPDSVVALRELGVSLEGVERASFRGIRFISEQGSVEADFPRERGVGIRRTALHDALASVADDAGVNLLWGARVGGVEHNAVLVDGRAVTTKWIVGADGQNSRVREWAQLNAGREYDRRIGIRRHFAVQPWNEYVEIYWGERGQAYVTAVAEKEVAVAIIMRQRLQFEAALEEFPALRERLRGVPARMDVRGAMTLTRKLKSATQGRVALVGDASGSADAITGEGLGTSFKQAAALARAMASGELAAYRAAHEHIRRLPLFMARTLLLMDRNAWVRRHALRALSANPALFRQLLAVHVGELPLRKFALPGAFDLGWEMIRHRGEFVSS